MKRILIVLAVILAGLAVAVRAQSQDVGLLEERVKQLLGKVENLEEANLSLKKQIEALVKETQSLREQVQNQPKPTTTSASQDELRELARKIQEVDEKRKADSALIAKEIKDLARLAGSGRTTSPRANANTSDRPMSGLPKEAIEHTIAPGDTLLAIALAYSKDTGKKITTDLILRANDGLKAERLIVGRKILVPIPDR